MKVLKKIWCVCALLSLSCSLYPTDLGPLSSIYGGIKSIVSTVGSKSFWDGVGRSFGASPSGYIVNFEVYNDSHQSVNVGLKGIASFMGAYFPSAKGIYNKKTLMGLLQNTSTSAVKASYNNEEFYFDLYMSTKSNPDDSPIYKQTFTQLGVKDDPKIYYYHTFTKRFLSEGQWSHGVGAEMLGYKDPSAKGEEAGNITISSQLSNMVFYNSTELDMQVSFKYGDLNLAITLEKDSYNMINVPTEKNSDGTSTPKFSLRPNVVTFTEKAASSSSSSSTVTKTLHLPSEGFEGYTYIVEVFQDSGQNVNVGIQGLTPGHYDQAVTPRIRDITPCPSTFWYQSVAQAGKDASSASVDLPGQVWVVYQGADSPVKSKVEVGKAISWNLIRPQVDQQDQKVLFLYVETTDDKTAEEFVDKFIGGSIGTSVMQGYEQKLSQQFSSGSSSVSNSTLSLSSEKSGAQSGSKVSSAQMVKNIDALVGSLSVDTGRIVDSTSKVVGYLLGADVFTPKGLGSGTYYYTLSPSILDVNSLVQLVASYVDSSKLSGGSDSSTEKTADVDSAIKTEVQGWLTDYVADPTTVEAKVTAYLEKYGKSSILGSGGKLNQFGQYRVQAIVSGNVSLQFPPMKLSTVTNHYVFDFGKNKPQGMPAATAV